MEKSQKVAKIFYCEICNYECSKQSDYIKHTNTAKHKNRINPNILDTSIAENREFKCKNCDKVYSARNSLWYHEKKCNQIDISTSDTTQHTTPVIDETTKITPELLVMLIQQNKEMQTMLIQQNKEMQTMMMEVLKNGTHNTTHTNSHNKTFNLQLFLNETCKNAMNIMDFVEDVVLNLNDLEETGRIGFAEGVSKMILKRLKNLDITERPIHCSDLKRETLYIKDNDMWEKEGEGNPKLTKAVKDIAYKNIKQIKTWQELHPDYKDPDSRTNDKYMKMLTNVMCGGTEEEIEDNYNKILKNIIKESTINKENYLI